jgi:PDZ domain/Aspartyl protease
MSIITLPFTLRSHHIIIDGRVNGAAATFILDTGSGMCVLDEDWASGRGLRPGPGAKAVGTDSMPISLATVDSLALADTIALHDEPVALVPLGDVSARHGRAIHGTIGFPFFMKYVVEIDYAARVLRLHDPATYVPSGTGERIPIDLSMRVPVLQAEFRIRGAAIPVRLVLDLGTGGYASVLTKPFVDRHAEALASRPSTERLLGTGVGGSIRGRATTLGAMQLGTLTVPNPYVALPAGDQGFFGISWADGTLGAPVLSRTRLILDYAHQQVMVEPVTALDAPFEFDKSGLSFHADGAHFETVVIDDVAAGSPAAQAGIAVGDVLRSVDGRSVTGDSIDWVSETLSQSGTIHSLRIEHDVSLSA